MALFTLYQTIFFLRKTHKKLIVGIWGTLVAIGFCKKNLKILRQKRENSPRNFLHIELLDQMNACYSNHALPPWQYSPFINLLSAKLFDYCRGGIRAILTVIDVDCKCSSTSCTS